MLIYRFYKTPLNPTKEQETHIKQAAGTARFVYNWGSFQWIEEYKNNSKTLSELEQSKLLNSLKKIEFNWMYNVSKCVTRYTLKDLDMAYKNFFRNIKKGKKSGFPKFKLKNKDKNSFFVDGFIHIGDNWIKLPRISNYAPCGEVIDIDLGVKDMEVLSKAKLKLSKLYYKISCIKGDSIHSFTSVMLERTKPAQESPCKIVIEDLNVKGVMRNHKLASSLSNVAFGAIYKELQLSKREWMCREYRILHNRDLSAVINLKNYTANSVGINACGDQVRPVKKHKLSNGQGRGSKNQNRGFRDFVE